jgi:energy-coupling factor transporter ATP-binding protein EcfA2
MILDEPTRGVDIGAKSEIYRIVDELAASGMGIIFISSELPEIIGVADRVLVMRGGRIAGQLDPAAGQAPTQEAIMQLATSADEATAGETAMSMPRQHSVGTGGGARPAAALQVMRDNMGFGLRALGMLPVLILLCIAFQLLTDRFASWQNVSIIMQQASINVVLAAGMTFVILTSGIDLSVGSILAMSAMVALIASKIPDWGMLGIPAGLLAGLACGAINGGL